MSPEEAERSDDARLGASGRAALRRHPVITAVMAVCIGGGMLCGALLLPAEWALARRVVGGAFGGLGVGLLISAYRMIGE